MIDRRCIDANIARRSQFTGGRKLMSVRENILPLSSVSQLVIRFIYFFFLFARIIVVGTTLEKDQFFQPRLFVELSPLFPYGLCEQGVHRERTRTRETLYAHARVHSRVAGAQFLPVNAPNN